MSTRSVVRIELALAGGRFKSEAKQRPEQGARILIRSDRCKRTHMSCQLGEKFDEGRKKGVSRVWRAPGPSEGTSLSPQRAEVRSGRRCSRDSQDASPEIDQKDGPGRVQSRKISCLRGSLPRRLWRDGLHTTAGPSARIVDSCWEIFDPRPEDGSASLMPCCRGARKTRSSEPLGLSEAARALSPLEVDAGFEQRAKHGTGYRAHAAMMRFDCYRSAILNRFDIWESMAGPSQFAFVIGHQKCKRAAKHQCFQIAFRGLWGHTKETMVETTTFLVFTSKITIPLGFCWVVRNEVRGMSMSQGNP